MEAKSKLLNLIRIACHHKIQGRYSEADVAFTGACMFWAKSGLPLKDWTDVECEFHMCKIDNGVSQSF